MWFSISLAGEDCRRRVVEPEVVSCHPSSHWRMCCRGDVAGRDCHRSSGGPVVEGVASAHEALLSATWLKVGVCGGGKDEPFDTARDLLTRRPPRRDLTKMHSCCSWAHLRHGGAPSESPLQLLLAYRRSTTTSSCNLQVASRLPCAACQASPRCPLFLPNSRVGCHCSAIDEELTSLPCLRISDPRVCVNVDLYSERVILYSVGPPRLGYLGTSISV